MYEKSTSGSSPHTCRSIATPHDRASASTAASRRRPGRWSPRPPAGRRGRRPGRRRRRSPRATVAGTTTDPGSVVGNVRATQNPAGPGSAHTTPPARRARGPGRRRPLPASRACRTAARRPRRARCRARAAPAGRARGQAPRQRRPGRRGAAARRLGRPPTGSRSSRPDRHHHRPHRRGRPARRRAACRPAVPRWWGSSHRNTPLAPNVLSTPHPVAVGECPQARRPRRRAARPGPATITRIARQAASRCSRVCTNPPGPLGCGPSTANSRADGTHSRAASTGSPSAAMARMPPPCRERRTPADGCHRRRAPRRCRLAPGRRRRPAGRRRRGVVDPPERQPRHLGVAEHPPRPPPPAATGRQARSQRQ